MRWELLKDSPDHPRGYGFACLEDDGTLLLGGSEVRFFFSFVDQPERSVDFLFVEEGVYSDGQWKPTRRLNGDDTWGRALAFKQPALRRIKLYSY